MMLCQRNVANKSANSEVEQQICTQAFSYYLNIMLKYLEKTKCYVHSVKCQQDHFSVGRPMTDNVSRYFETASFNMIKILFFSTSLIYSRIM